MAQRPTVVVLHSSAGSPRQWQELIETLQPRFRVLAIDFHGHGARPDWRGGAPLTLADDAALVEPLLAQAGGAHVVGHSYGAAVALKLATLHPRLVLSVAAYEPVVFRLLLDDGDSHRPAQDVTAVSSFVRDQLARGAAIAAAQRFIEFWSGAGAWESLPAGARQAVAARMRSVLRHFDALFCEPHWRFHLARLRMPMLLLTGARTVAATRRIGELLRDLLPRAHHEVLAGMGHMGPITHPKDVNQRIAQFLNAIPPERARALARP